MTGREEQERQIRKKTEAVLRVYPSYIKEWYYNLVASGMTARSCDEYVRSARRFLSFIDPHIKRVQLCQITPDIVDQYMVSLQTVVRDGCETRSSDSARQTAWCILNKLFGFLYERGYIERNYMQSVGKPKNQDLQRINEHRILLTKEDFAAMIKLVDVDISETQTDYEQFLCVRNKLILTLLMVTGMRVGALVSININDLDVNNHKLLVVDKGEKHHEYVLSDDVVELIQQYLQLRNKRCSTAPALLTNKYNVRVTRQVISDVVSHYSQAALGYKISPHKLRAGFCSILYNETQNAEFVRRAVGHSNITTTQRYIVTDNREKQEASAIMNSVLGFDK